MAEIDVDPDLLLPIAAGIVHVGGLRTERGVDRVAEEEVGGVRPRGDAGVPARAAGELPAHAGDRGRVAHRAAEPGREPARKRSWKEKQSGSAKTRSRAAGSGTWFVMVTVGQFAEPSPRAARTSPTSRVRPLSLLNTPPRVFGSRQ